MSDNLQVSERELATILAALRLWQREGHRLGDCEDEIATDGQTLDRLTDTEIDLLCERLNFGE
jgi:hypothetical protein